MRAYDDAVVEANGASTTPIDLNLVDDWNFETPDKVPVRKVPIVTAPNNEDEMSLEDEDGSEYELSGERRGDAKPPPARKRKRSDGRRSTDFVEPSKGGRGRPPKRVKAAPKPTVREGGHRDYVSVLGTFESRSNERWEDFLHRIREERNYFKEMQSDEQQDKWAHFATSQTHRWKWFVEEEEALLLWNTSVIERMVDEDKSFSAEYVSLVERFVSRRQERLEDCCKRLRQDASEFWSGPSKIVGSRWDEFMEIQEERWRYFKHSEEAVMKLHIGRCEETRSR
eukprot:CAMPEP_0116550144 /NCGR_PEP_ID=MMETSP0397-20121206/5268_1 /TAXON_ID=216820 /ORGANISM="Cyclophora tenuis, Strain ECT3854" /LENGTH=282 /DNA_ID=CAMNT_0004074951 /DNA_START=126 /DNA_END=974 /DNA_ORIENTATION=-